MIGQYCPVCKERQLLLNVSPNDSQNYQCYQCHTISNKKAKYCYQCGAKCQQGLVTLQTQETQQQIQIKITDLQEEIFNHRSLKPGNVETKFCWYFGFSQINYGTNWSSCDYWKSLIKANKQICTSNMHFTKNKNCCQKCEKVIDSLEIYKYNWEKIIKKKISNNQIC